jgi:hypothetical protein
MAGLILSIYIGLCVIGLLAPQNVQVNPDLTVTILPTDNSGATVTVTPDNDRVPVDNK